MCWNRGFKLNNISEFQHLWNWATRNENSMNRGHFAVRRFWRQKPDGLVPIGFASIFNKTYKFHWLSKIVRKLKDLNALKTVPFKNDLQRNEKSTLIGVNGRTKDMLLCNAIKSRQTNNRILTNTNNSVSLRSSLSSSIIIYFRQHASTSTHRTHIFR